MHGLAARYPVSMARSSVDKSGICVVRSAVITSRSLRVIIEAKVTHRDMHLQSSAMAQTSRIHRRVQVTLPQPLHTLMAGPGV